MQNLHKPVITTNFGVTVVTLSAESDNIYDASLVPFEDVLELAEIVDPPKLLVDLWSTNYMDSSFIGVLFRVYQKVTRHTTGRFGLCNLSDSCRAELTCAGMDRIFDLFATRADAIATYSQGMHE